MIVITEIKTIETPYDWLEYTRANLPEVAHIGDRELIENKEFFIRELVKGVRFRKPNGEEIVIGITNQASDVLGIVYDAYHNMNQAIEEQIRLKNKYRDNLSKAAKWINTSFFKKLYLMLFDCVVYEKMKSLKI